MYIRGETISSQILFEEEKPLRFHKKSLSTFVQTDKGIYKPGQTVKYRIINVSPDLLPFNGTISVQIIDPNQNVINQQVDKALTKGRPLL